MFFESAKENKCLVADISTHSLDDQTAPANDRKDERIETPAELGVNTFVTNVSEVSIIEQNNILLFVLNGTKNKRVS